jgi:hypothetical protein
MVPRGEVGVVVATLGLTAGLLSVDLFSAILVAVLGTTVAAPYLLGLSVPRAIAAQPGRSDHAEPDPGPG